MSKPLYTDDKTISDDVELYRRIPPLHFHLDGNLGRMRPSKAAFDDDDDESPMSVVLADVLSALGRAPESVVAGHEGFALAAITAGLVRECNQGVVRDPQDEEPAHGLVFGRKTDSVRKKLARQCRWVIEPPAKD